MRGLIGVVLMTLILTLGAQSSPAAPAKDPCATPPQAQANDRHKGDQSRADRHKEEARTDRHKGVPDVAAPKTAGDGQKPQPGAQTQQKPARPAGQKPANPGCP